MGVAHKPVEDSVRERWIAPNVALLPSVSGEEQTQHEIHNDQNRVHYGLL